MRIDERIAERHADLTPQERRAAKNAGSQVAISRSTSARTAPASNA